MTSQKNENLKKVAYECTDPIKLEKILKQNFKKLKISSNTIKKLPTDAMRHSFKQMLQKNLKNVSNEQLNELESFAYNIAFTKFNPSQVYRQTYTQLKSQKIKGYQTFKNVIIREAPTKKIEKAPINISKYHKILCDQYKLNKTDENISINAKENMSIKQSNINIIIDIPLKK